MFIAPRHRRIISAPIVRSFALVLLILALAACGAASTPTATPQVEPTVSDTIQPSPTALPPSPTLTGSAPATAVPTSTATPAPTSTATPLPTPAPTVVATTPPQPALEASRQTPPATSISRLADEAMEFLEMFTRDLSPRASGTAQEKAAADFLAREFEAIGYQAELQPFTVDVESSEVVVGPEDQEVISLPLRLSVMGKASGILVHVGEALEGDIPPERLEGKIALIKRGRITFSAKVDRVADAGAVAAVVYNHLEGHFRGTLSEQGRIPAVSISREGGGTILALLDQGEVMATVSASFETRDSQNVIAEKPGTDTGAGVIVLGGHYDTVPEVPGVNDNGSGIATLLTIAREVSDRTYPFTLSFIAFGSEELGLVGSGFYTQSLSPQEQEAIVMMLNFDALASGNTLELLGDSELVNTVIEIGLARRGVPPAGASSDHASFQQIGVPAVFFAGSDFSRIHTPEDRLEFVRPEFMGRSAVLAIDLLNSLDRR